MKQTTLTIILIMLTSCNNVKPLTIATGIPEGHHPENVPFEVSGLENLIAFLALEAVFLIPLSGR